MLNPLGPLFALSALGIGPMWAPPVERRRNALERRRNAPPWAKGSRARRKASGTWRKGNGRRSTRR